MLLRVYNRRDRRESGRDGWREGGRNTRRKESGGGRKGTNEKLLEFD